MSIFTRRHYEWLTKVSRQIIDSRAETPKDAISVLADALASESVGFDRQRFLTNVLSTPKLENE
jgi:hypothetical protein